MTTATEPRYSPYQGLIPYSENDSGFFFGREKDTRLIIANLFASPLTLLYGPSGVGKSSVLRAGAVHQLNQRQDVCVVVHSVWNTDPLADLRTKVCSLEGVTASLNPARSFGDFLTECSGQAKKRLMIILDQFEEYFLYHPNVDEFTVQFSQAVMQANIPASFLVSIREDALAKLDRFEGRIPILFDNYLRLEHLDDAGARSAIEKPIRKYNELYMAGKPQIQIEPGLVDQVLHDLKTGHISLGRAGIGVVQGEAQTIETPYLQLIMTRLWNEERKVGSYVLRQASLKSLGGAEKIVRTHLDAAMRQLTIGQRVLAARIFQYLVTPSGTKIALRASDLATFTDSSARKVEALLQRLSQRDIRLLRAVDTAGKRENSYEIFHDVLGAPILDWRARFRRRNRLVVIGLPIAVLLFFTISTLASVVWFYGYSTSGISDNGDPYDTAVILMLTSMCCALLFIPAVLGFFIGRNMSRAR